jgi:hypothetical protein
MPSALPLLAMLVLSAPPAAGAPPTYDFAAVPSLERLRAVKLLPPSDVATAHPFEERGFVTVPMDYARPRESPKLRIFYRLMPAQGSTPRDGRAPLLVVVNGGPGAPSGIYRGYDYDYEHPTEKMRQGDVLSGLLTRFRVLIADQRGTPGHSSALDMDGPHVDPAVVARYFDSVHHALDLQEVIRAVVPEGEPFYLLAQSYAGMIGMRYMTLPGMTRLPRGIVFSSSALPHGDVLFAFQARRRAQRALNVELGRAAPEAKDLLARLRAHFRESGLDPDGVHYLWEWLGKGPAGTWEPALVAKVKALLTADRKALEAFVHAEAAQADLLNYILSAKELTPGFTDRTLAARLVKDVPFEDWMLDEQWTLIRPHGDASWIAPMLDALDRAPPPLDPPFPPLPPLRERLARTNVLFTIGRGDAFVAEESATRHVKDFAVEGRTRVLVLPGGHKAAFLPEGVEAIRAWIAALPAAAPMPARTPAR